MMQTRILCDAARTITTKAVDELFNWDFKRSVIKSLNIKLIRLIDAFIVEMVRGNFACGRKKSKIFARGV